MKSGLCGSQLCIRSDTASYAIGDDDEVEDRVINNHQCEILMPHKVKVALQDLRSIFSLF